MKLTSMEKVRTNLSFTLKGRIIMDCSWNELHQAPISGSLIRLNLKMNLQNLNAKINETKPLSLTCKILFPAQFFFFNLKLKIWLKKKSNTKYKELKKKNHFFIFLFYFGKIANRIGRQSKKA
jgi:hypothetical protein